MDEKGLGKRLQQARRAAGLTQQQLCVQANLSYSTLAKIERGAIKSPSIFTIQSIAGALNVTLDELIGAITPVLASAVLLPSQTNKRVSKSGIRFVYFDMNDVLIRFHTAAFTQLARDSGQSIETVESVFWQYNVQVNRGEVSLDQLNTAWAERLGIMVDWKKYYMAAVDKMPGMTELVTWVADQYHVGIMSNTMPGFIETLRERQMLPVVNYEAIIDSSVIKMLKPDADMYEYATTKAGVLGSEILLIDDARPNLATAEKFGWHTIWFDAYQPDESIQAIRESLEPAS